MAQSAEARLSKELTADTTTNNSGAAPGLTVALSSAGVGMQESPGQAVLTVAKGATASALDATEVPFVAARDIAVRVVSAAETRSNEVHP